MIRKAVIPAAGYGTRFLPAAKAQPKVALEGVDPAKVGRYGVVDGTPITDDLYLIRALVEKPSALEAPSNLAIASRYAFSPRVFECIDRTSAGKNQEIQLTDAMQLMLRDSAMYGCVIDGSRHDMGNKLDFLRTNVLFGLEHPEVRDEFRQFIRDLGGNLVAEAEK